MSKTRFVDDRSKSDATAKHLHWLSAWLQYQGSYKQAVRPTPRVVAALAATVPVSPPSFQSTTTTSSDMKLVLGLFSW